MNKDTKAKHLSNSALIFLIAAPVIIIDYIIFILNPGNAGNHIAYTLQITADFFSIITVTGLWLTILLDALTPSHQHDAFPPSTLFLKNKRPTVDVYIPVAGEPIEVIEKTAKAALAMMYPHKTFILDDGKSNEVKALSEELGITYVRRETNHNAKSGNVNNGLLHGKGEFFAILDADFVPKKNFIIHLLSFMVHKEVAFVQSPQSYDNLDNFIARGTSTAQEIFYDYVQPAKNSSNSAFCVGTNVLFRRRAIDEIGGMFELDHSEDIWTSLMLHEHGWKSIYTTRVIAVGQAPDTIMSYLKQQKRWAQGGFTIFFSRNPLLSRKLNYDQKVQYMYSALFYFVGISIMLYLTLPLLYLYFGISPIKLTNSNEWLYRYVPYLAIFYLLPILLTGKISLSAISTSIATFSSYVSALLNTIVSRRYVWVTTSSSKARSGQILSYIWPHLLVISLSIGAVVMGWFAVQDTVITAINSFWALVNTTLLALFLIRGSDPVKINREKEKKVEIVRIPKGAKI